MSRFWSITKTILKNSFNFIGFNSKKNKRSNSKKRSQSVLLVIFVLLFGSVAFSFFYSFKEIFTLAINYNLTQMVVQSLIPVGILLFLCLSMTLLTSVFFLSNDNAVFLPLPIKPKELFFSRFLVVLIYTYIMEIIFVLPILIAYDYVINPAFIGYLSQFIFFIVFPIIPLSIGFLISLLISKIFNISKHKDAFSIIMASIFIIIVVAVQLASSFLSESDINDPSSTIGTMQNSLSFLRFYTGFFDRAILYDNGFGLGQIGIISLISIGIFLMCYLLANFTYIKSLRGSDDGATKRKKTKRPDNLSKVKYSSSKFLTLSRKEAKSLFRTPIYVFNLIVPPLMIIIVFAVSFLGAFLSKNGSSMVATLEQLRQAVSKYLTMDNGFVILIMVCVSLFIASTSPISSTAISREGNNAYLMKTYPVNSFTLINSKVSLAILINSIFTLLVLGGLTLLLHASFWLFFTSFILSFGVNILTNYIMILIDLNSPTLNFTNETAAVKQNKSTIFGMLVDFGILIIFALLTYLFIEIPLNGWLIFAIFAVFLVLLNVWIILYIKYKGKDIYNKF